ncbi:MAG: hypothetical protein RL227_2718 [Pseudomonadota bacterium]
MNREAERQQWLVAALWRDDAVPEGAWRAPARATAAQGLAAYRSNAGATAERALGAAFPTVAALVGTQPFAALARHFWHAHPPPRGDLGEWGAELPAFIAGNGLLADVPYLSASARLDWAVHRAARAADAPAGRAAGPAALLQALATTDPDQLRVPLADGAALVSSDFPIATVWRAHQGGLSFDAARAALAAQEAEHAFVWRDARYEVHVQALAAADARFTAALLQPLVLSAALDAAGPGFAFDRWLAQALGERWLGIVDAAPAAG